MLNCDFALTLLQSDKDLVMESADNAQPYPTRAFEKSDHLERNKFNLLKGCLNSFILSPSHVSGVSFGRYFVTIILQPLSEALGRIVASA